MLVAPRPFGILRDKKPVVTKVCGLPNIVEALNMTGLLLRIETTEQVNDILGIH